MVVAAATKLSVRGVEVNSKGNVWSAFKGCVYLLSILMEEPVVPCDWGDYLLLPGLIKPLWLILKLLLGHLVLMLASRQASYEGYKNLYLNLAKVFHILSAAPSEEFVLFPEG